MDFPHLLGMLNFYDTFGMWHPSVPLHVRLRFMIDDDERVEVVGELLENYLRTTGRSTAQQNLKNAEESRRAIACASSALQLAKDKQCALFKYSRAISLAPLDSEVLSTGYANRSAVLLMQRRFDAVLRDVDRAEAAGSPHYLLEERRAHALYALDRIAEAHYATGEALRLLASARPAVPAAEVTAVRRRFKAMASARHRTPVADTRKPLPPLAGGQHPTIPGLSARVAVKYSRDRQRYLEATADIEPGDVLIVERPLAAILKETHFDEFCFHCFKRSVNMVPCRQCSTAMFCSETCRDESWTSYHSVECAIVLLVLRTHDETGIPYTHLLLALRLMLATCSAHGGLRALRKKLTELKEEQRVGDNKCCIFAADGSYDPASLRAVYCLPRASVMQQADHQVYEIAVFAAYLLHMLKTCTNFLQGDRDEALARFTGGLLLHFLAIHANCLIKTAVYKDDQLFQFGDAIYAISSLVNHSCDPNVFRTTFNGNFLVLVAWRPIAAGEEICMAYSDVFHAKDRTARRAYLLERYHFECNCRACLGYWPVWKIPTMQRIDFTFKCASCVRSFQSGINTPYRTLCPHCGKPVDLSSALRHLLPELLVGPLSVRHDFLGLVILDFMKKKSTVELGKAAAAVKDMCMVMEFPNDVLHLSLANLVEVFLAKGNLTTDSW